MQVVTLVRDILVCVVIMGAPVAVGSVHTEVVIGLAALSLIAWALRDSTESDRPSVGPRAVSIPSLAFWLFALVSAIQLLPWPPLLHGLLDPTGHHLYQEGWRALFGDSTPPSTWRGSSLDPARTFDRGLRWLTLALAAGLGLERARRHEGWQTLARLALLAGLLVGAVGALQQWAGSDRVLFVYHPSVPLPGPTTFVSDNHAAAASGLASLAGFFLAFRTPRRHPLEGILAGLAAIGLMLLMSSFHSAGTTLAFSLATGLFLILFAGTRTAGAFVPVASIRSAMRAFGALLLAVPAIGALVVASGPASWSAWLWNTHLGGWLQQKAATRFELVRASLEATGDFWLLGAGGGATERVLPPYVDWGVVPPATLSTIENEPVEWLFHYGLPAGLLGIALLLGYGWFLYRRYRPRPRFRYAAGLSLALYLAVLSQFHFPFVALGVSLPVVALLEALAFPVKGEKLDGGERSTRLSLERGLVVLGPRLRRTLVGATGLGVIVFALGHFAFELDLSSLESDESPPPDYEQLVAQVPADGDLYMHAALATDPSDRATAVRRASHAFEREPTAKMGIYAAHVHRRVGVEQRAFELYREVYGGEFRRVPLRWITSFVLPDFSDPGRLAEILRRAPERGWRLAARQLRRASGPEAAVQFGLALYELRPESFHPHEILVDNYLRLDRAFLAETWVRQIAADADPTDTRHERRLRLLVRVLLAQDKKEAARRELVDAFARSPVDNPELAGRLVELRPDPPADASGRAARALDRARGLLCGGDGGGSPGECWQAEAWLHEHRGDHAKARAVYRGLSETRGDPRPLARYLSRRGACKELEQFADDWHLAVDRSETHRDALADLLTDCRRD